MTPRRIMLVTTSRADYGIQSHLARMLQDDPGVELLLVASGTHLSARHGMTVREIERDGLRVASRLDIGIDLGLDVSGVMARALELFSGAVRELRPDLCVLLGDRFEMMSAAIACTLSRVPIAHLHGGETTEGAVDEVFRHSITKASWLHFAACEEYRRRIIQLGESPDRVFNVGSLGVENARRMKLLDRGELSEALGMPLGKRMFVVTFHPETASGADARRQVAELLGALDGFPDATLLFTRPNADSGGNEIAECLGRYVDAHANAAMRESLGARLYLSAVKAADAVVGNSSSGIIEAPSLGTPTVNVGCRQRGRVRAGSVVDCGAERSAISSAIDRALALSASRDQAAFANPYESDGTAGKIASVLRGASLDGAATKKFYDLRNGR